MDLITNCINEKCSTPLLGQNTVPPYFPVSEIRLDNAILEGGNSYNRSTTKKKPKPQRRKYIQKNPRIADTNSDSEYETVSEHESIFDELDSSAVADSDTRFLTPISPRISQSANKNIKLFYSPNEANYENNHAYDDFSGVTSSTFSNNVISSPVFQKCFFDAAKFKSYSGPGQKNRLNSSQIRFSQKSARQHNIPCLEDTTFLGTTIPVAADWTNKSLSHRAEELWEDFTQKFTLPNKSVPVNKNRTATKKPRTEYSHLRMENDRCKRFTSPHKRSVFDEEDVLEGRVTSQKMRKFPLKCNNSTLICNNAVTSKNDDKSHGVNTYLASKTSTKKKPMNSVNLRGINKVNDGLPVDAGKRSRKVGCLKKTIKI